MVFQKKLWQSLKRYSATELIGKLLRDLLSSLRDTSNIIFRLLLIPLILLVIFLLLIVLALKNIVTFFRYLTRLVVGEIRFHTSRLARASAALKDDCVYGFHYLVDVMEYLWKKVLDDSIRFSDIRTKPDRQNYPSNEASSVRLMLSSLLLDTGWWLISLAIVIVGVIWFLASLRMILSPLWGQQIWYTPLGFLLLLIPPTIQMVIRESVAREGVTSQ